MKGKTEGKKIFFPMETDEIPVQSPGKDASETNQDEKDTNDGENAFSTRNSFVPASGITAEQFEIYETGLEAYYKGNWSEARKNFKKCGIEAAEVFLGRMGNKSAPENWSGIWTMETK